MIANVAPVTSMESSIRESTAEDLATQRYLLDLALQPLDRWDGFVQLEQVGSSALRYQLNMISYALAMAQFTRTPAFTGYLAEAQRNAIEKMRDKRVWGYWALEHLLGYRRWDPDPIAHANVMYTAYFGLMIGLYETLNEDRRFDRPGSLSLRWNDKTTFAYDFRSLTEAIRRNMLADESSPQYPCEPHLVYPICNTFACNTLLTFDRLHGTDLTGDLIDRVRTSFDRDGWRRPSGRFLSGRTAKSNRIVFPPAVGNDAFLSYWLNPSMPDLARSTYELVRERFVRHDGERAALVPAKRGRVDVGNYRFTRGEVFSQGVTILAAREHGDDEVASALLRTVESENEHTWSNGARQLVGVSTLTNALLGLVRFSRADSLRDLVDGRVPPTWRAGPILAEVAYPDVLVARAVTDGRALDLVLRPGDGPRRTTIAIERLEPGCSYRLSGTTMDRVTAGPDGRILVDVDLEGRTEVRMWPAP